MKITIEQLRNLGACRTGKDNFRRMFPSGEFNGQWTKKKQMELLRAGKLHRWLYWLTQNSLLPLWSLSMADLSDCRLRGAVFERMDLANAIFCGADLREAVFTAAAVQYANFSDAKLKKADFGGVRACGARFEGADLQDSCFWRADLRNANFHNANLRNAELCAARLEGAYLGGADLTGAYRDDDDPPISGWVTGVDGKLYKNSNH